MRFVQVLMVAAVVFCSEAAAAHPLPCTVSVVRVIDGDTLVVRQVTLLALGVAPIASTVSVRLLRVDTPERGEPDYARAKTLLEALTQEPIALEVKGRDSWGRWLAELYSCADAGRQNINDTLRSEGWVYP